MPADYKNSLGRLARRGALPFAAYAFSAFNA